MRRRASPPPETTTRIVFILECAPRLAPRERANGLASVCLTPASARPVHASRAASRARLRAQGGCCCTPLPTPSPPAFATACGLEQVSRTLHVAASRHGMLLCAYCLCSAGYPALFVRRLCACACARPDCTWLPAADTACRAVQARLHAVPSHVARVLHNAATMPRHVVSQLRFEVRARLLRASRACMRVRARASRACMRAHVCALMWVPCRSG